MAQTRKKRVLAVASGGGHWIQLLRLRPAFAECEVIYATINPGGRAQVAPARFYLLPDANKERKLALIWLILRAFWLVLRTRPDVVLTTGAAPGYFALRIGRLFGARTLFIDSIANAERLSLSAQMAVGHVDLVLTQWPELAKDPQPKHRGSVL
jgi:hypothetical protein